MAGRQGEDGEATEAELGRGTVRIRSAEQVKLDRIADELDRIVSYEKLWLNPATSTDAQSRQIAEVRLKMAEQLQKFVKELDSK